MRSVIIIGGGIIGLSIGWRLLRQGCRVHILDKAKAGEQASRAAAGMLAPYSEDASLFQSGLRSLALYSPFLQELAEESSLSIPLEGKGTLYVALNRHDREILSRHQLPALWLSGEEARELEPLLSPRVQAALLFPSDRHLNNRLLLQALLQAIQKRGGQVSERKEVNQIMAHCQSVSGVKLTTGELLEAGIVINAAGAWAGSIHCQECSDVMPVRPVKGEILTLRQHRDFEISYMIRTPRVYMALKSEGSLRIGATSEEKGFDETPTAAALMQLLQAAWEVVPAIEQCPFEEIRAGFRPVTPNQLPLIQKSRVRGLYWAAGHGRAGILLAPLTAHLISKKLLEET